MSYASASSTSSLLRTSPVKHSLWIRTSGGTSGPADTAAGQAEGEMLPAVGEARRRCRSARSCRIRQRTAAAA